MAKVSKAEAADSVQKKEEQENGNGKLLYLNDLRAKSPRIL